MKIAVSSTNKSSDSQVDPRFGRAGCFMIYDSGTKMWECLDNNQNLQSAQGAGIQSAALIVNSGCQVLITGHCGPKAFAALSKASVEVYTVAGGTAEEAAAAFERGKLEKLESADVEGHW